MIPCFDKKFSYGWPLTKADHNFVIHEFQCGHENNVPALGVATGIFDVKDLEKIADATLEDFSDVEKTIEILRNCQRIERECFNYDIQPSREPEQEPI